LPIQSQPAAATIVTVTNSDSLWAALTAAHAGDTILLSPGTYSPITLQNFQFDGTVSVQSADSSNLAVLTGLKLIGTSGLAFNNFDMPLTGESSTGAIVMSSSNISLSGLRIHGTTGIDEGLGVMVRDSTGVTVKGSEFTLIGSGIAHLNSKDITFSNNSFHGLQTDGIVGGGSSHVLIEGNHFTTFHPEEGDHPDAIQFFGASDGSPGNDVTIRDNVITRGEGDVYQGIFFENTNNVTVTGNAMAGTMYNGISLYGVHTALIEDNFVQGFTDEGTRIIVRGQSSDVTVTHNVTEDLFNYQDNGLPNPNYVSSDNTSIGPTTAADLSAFNTWLARHDKVTLTGPTPDSGPVAPVVSVTPVVPVAPVGGPNEMTPSSIEKLIHEAIANNLSSTPAGWFIL
jgi:parallel beta-helix repeat protein